MPISWPDPKAISKVPHKRQHVVCKVVSVYDGDTFKALVPIGDAFLKLAIRVNGIDSPEVRARRNNALAPLEKQAALAVRDRVAELLDQQETVICPLAWDKYGGRLLADCWLPSGESLSEWLLQRGLVKAYHGARKQPWTQAELEAIIKAS